MNSKAINKKLLKPESLYVVTHKGVIANTIHSRAFLFGGNNMVIYMATNKINGKSYVGQTISNLKQRKEEHIRSALNNKTNMYFGKAIKKYGPDNFIWKILAKCNNINELNELEVYYIKFYNTFGKGYNLNSGGLNNTHSYKTRQQISKKLKGRFKGKNSPNFGKKASNKTKHKLSISHKGHKISEITRQKLSEARKGEKNPMFGKKHSEETKRKISAALTGKTISEITRQKLSEARKGEKNPMFNVHRCGENASMFGKKHSEESKRKMSESHINKNILNKRKKDLLCLNK